MADTGCVLNGCQRSQGSGTWVRVAGVKDALPVCEVHWQALRCIFAVPLHHEADADDTDRFGFRWGNVRVTRLMQAARGKTRHRVLSVTSQRQTLEVYVTEGRGDIRAFRDGHELVMPSQADRQPPASASVTKGGKGPGDLDA